MFNKNQRIEIAKNTVDIVNKGKYKKSNKEIPLYTDMKFKSFLVKENEFSQLPQNTLRQDKKSEVIFTKNGVVKTILDYAGEENGKVAVLNFASAKNAGGGYKNGSMSQEEAIAYCSNLEQVLSYDKKVYNDFYMYHRQNSLDFYSSRMIYTENLAVFKDENFGLLDIPIHVDVITSCAVNVRNLKRQHKTQQVKESPKVMEERIEKVIQLAISQKVDTLILGAFGAGVFENSIYKIKNSFEKVLNKKEYKNAFKKIIFAVTDNKGTNNFGVLSTLRY